MRRVNDILGKQKSGTALKDLIYRLFTAFEVANRKLSEVISE